MELRDIEYFAVVAEHGHLGRAAESLELSTAALSKCLRRLESALQVRLVRRTPRGVELTLEGQTLLTRVLRLRLSLADVAREVGDLSNGRVGHVRVGAHPGLSRALLARACSVLAQEAPNVTLAVTIASNEALESALAKGELDLILNSIPAAVAGTVQEPLYDDEFVVYCAASHRLAKRKRVTLADIAQERWVMWAPNVPSWQRLHEAFAHDHLPAPRIAVLTSSVSLRLDIVASSDLLGMNLRQVVREAAPRYGIAELRVAGVTLHVRTGVTYRDGAYLPPSARRFVEVLKATAKQVARSVSVKVA
ncbi:MAG: bacterial regulatory helix-turn-helix, lysR family protein [Betaproteobacteria bacterium]|nr:bacterial regulatory helix-turn-helix, lysR family protein [Betaproteobacteria bacterium]